MENRNFKKTFNTDLSIEITTNITNYYFKKIYILKFGKLPCVALDFDIDTTQFMDKFKDIYSTNCIDYYYKKHNEQNINSLSKEYFFFEQEVLVIINHNDENVYILNSNHQESITLANTIREFVFSSKKKSKAEIGLIIFKKGETEINTKAIKTPKICVNSYYNDDFKVIDNVIKQRINRNNDKGLILLHGLPGTGKTNYIKHLIEHTSKEVLFIPPSMAESITHPSFLPLLLERDNFILIIEDAEKIILNREHNNNNSAVSALLNLSDGILSDCLNVQIICSFNTDVSKIDQALMRKGRLIASYEFKALETEKANALSKNLGFDSFFTEPQTLTNIFNQDDKNYSNIKKQVIGF